MEKIDFYGSLKVKGWNEKYKMLKHLRWIRNQIAHGEQQAEIVADDLIELKNFHDQLLNVKDPLAMVLQNQNKNQDHIVDDILNGTPIQSPTSIGGEQRTETYVGGSLNLRPTGIAAASSKQVAGLKPCDIQCLQYDEKQVSASL